MHRFLSYSFIASDGSEESTEDSVVSPLSIVMHHGFRSIEASRSRRQKYRFCQTPSHSLVLVASQCYVFRKLHQAFLLVDSFKFNFVDEGRSDVLLKLEIVMIKIRKQMQYVCKIAMFLLLLCR